MAAALSRPTRKLTACGAGFFLLALALLSTVPHTWHKEDGGARACAICQAYHMPAQAAASPIQIEPPQATLSEELLPRDPSARSHLLPAPVCRAPPF